LIDSSPAALAVIIDTPGGELRVIDVHLDVGLNIPERVLQLRPAVLKQPFRAVVAGDFNTNDYVWAAGHVPLLPIDAVAGTSQADALDDHMDDIAFDTPTKSFGST
jgi:endonuclease/exonuclease/phosphatase family metal-dependent hydrolase